MLVYAHKFIVAGIECFRENQNPIFDGGISMAIFSNQASLSYSGGVTNSNVVTGELLEVLEISKTSVGETYEAGGIVTYAIQLINTGSTNLTGLTVTDNLGAYLYEDQLLVPLVYIEDTLRYFVNGILQNTPVVTATGGLTVTGLTVPPQGKRFCAPRGRFRNRQYRNRDGTERVPAPVRHRYRGGCRIAASDHSKIHVPFRGCTGRYVNLHLCDPKPRQYPGGRRCCRLRDGHL